jgi:hypothetical protein
MMLESEQNWLLEIGTALVVGQMPLIVGELKKPVLAALTRKQQKAVLRGLQQSEKFETVAALRPVRSE